MSMTRDKYFRGNKSLSFARFQYTQALQCRDNYQYVTAYSHVKSAYNKIKKYALLKETAPEFLEILDNLAEFTGYVGQCLEESEYRKQFVHCCKMVYGRDSAEYIGAMEKLAISFENMYDYEESSKIWAILTSRCQEVFGTTSTRTAIAWNRYIDSIYRLDSQSPRLKKKISELIQYIFGILEQYKNSPLRGNEREFEQMFKFFCELRSITLFEDDYVEQEYNIGKEIVKLGREIYKPDSEELLEFLEESTCWFDEDYSFGIYQECFEIRKRTAISDKDVLVAESMFYDNIRGFGLKEAKDIKDKIQDKENNKRLNEIAELNKKYEIADKEHKIKILLEKIRLWDEVNRDNEKLTCFQEIIKLCGDEDKEDIILAKENIAEILLFHGSIEAIDVCKEILVMRRDENASDENLFTALGLLSTAYDTFDKTEEHLDVVKERLALAWKNCAIDEVIAVMKDLADCLRKLQRYDEELQERASISAITKNYYGEASGMAMDALKQEQEAALTAGKIEYANFLLKHIYLIYKKSRGKFCYLTIKAYHDWICSLCLSGQYQKALTEQQKMVEQLKSHHTLLESARFILDKETANNIYDACMILARTAKAKSPKEKLIHSKVLKAMNEPSNNDFSFVQELKQELIAEAWREASGKA